MHKNELGLLIHTAEKINLKWFIDLNVIGKTIKLLGDYMGANFHDLGLGNGFLIGYQKHK